MNIKEEATAVKSMTMTDGWSKVLVPRLQEWRRALLESLVTVTEHLEVIKIQRQITAIDKLFNTIDGIVLEGEKAEEDEYPQEEDSQNLGNTP